MKYLLLTLISFFFTTHLFTQNIEQEYIFSKEHYNKIYTALNVNETTYLGGSMLECKAGAVSAISHDNNLLFNDTIPQDHYESFWHVSNLELRESDSIIIGSGNWNITFDVGNPDIDGHYIFGMDLAGNKLFENHLPGIYSSNPSLTLIPSGMIIHMNMDLIWLDHMGEIQNIIAYGIPSFFKGVENIDDNTLLAYSSNEAVFMSNTGVVSHSFSSTDEILSVYLDEFNIYFLRQNDLMIYDIATTNITYSTNHLSSTNTPQNIIGNSTSLFIYGGNGYPNDQVVQLDKNNLNVVGAFIFDQEETEIEFIIATEDELQLIGEKDNYQSFIKSKTITNPLQYENIDIGISNVQAIDSLIIIDSFMPFGSDFYLYEFEDNKITYSFDVTNLGSDPVTSFSIVSSYNLSPFGCYEDVTSKYFENINILPNETETFTNSYSYGYIFQNTIIPAISATLFAPNHKFDLDLTNNRAMDVTPVITNTEEINSLISSWNISPNPANDFILFNASLISNPKGVNISIYNSQGQEVVSRILNPQGNVINEKIVINHLPNGIYWLSIHTLNDVQTKSFVVVK